MIKKIKKLKNCGIFTDLNTIDRNDFNEKNIIYGWNYSGKTTISRFFNLLNKKKDIPEDLSCIEFEIELEDKKIFTIKNKKDFPYLVKVFNSDYINDNISFDQDSKKTKGIPFILGEDTATTYKNLN